MFEKLIKTEKEVKDNLAQLSFKTVEASELKNPAKISFQSLMPSETETIPERQEAKIIFPTAPTPANKVQQKFIMQLVDDDTVDSLLPDPKAVLDEAHLNKQNEQPTKKLNNWFTRMIDQKGENCFDSISADEVSRNAERILNDMMTGRIDYNKQGQYIIQPIIIETLINYCNNKLAINGAIQHSLGYFYNDYTNKQYFVNDQNRMAALCIDDATARNISQAIAITNVDIGIYTILYNKLNFVNYTKNPSSLFSIVNELKVYNNQMKNRY